MGRHYGDLRTAKRGHHEATALCDLTHARVRGAAKIAGPCEASIWAAWRDTWVCASYARSLDSLFRQ